MSEGPVQDLRPVASRQSGDEEALFTDSTLAPLRFWMLSIGIGSGLFLAMIDTSIVSTSLFTIGAEFNSLATINWVALSYTLSYLGCAVLFARLADVFGRRDAFLAAFVIFFGFSIGCGFASNLNQLIAMRALQGVGGSGLYSLSMVIWPELASESMRQYIAGLAGVVIAVAGVLGPVLGGILTYYASWRWIFWINGPIGAISMVIFIFTWPKAEYLPKLERRSWKSLDFLGSFLLIAAAVLVTFAFQNASSDVGSWSRAIFIAPLVTGVFCWVALFSWEWVVETRWKHTVLAAFPMQLLRNRVFVTTVLNTIFLGFPALMTVYVVPLRLQVVNGKSSLLAGVMLLPMLGGISLGSFLAGAINNNKNRISETLILASSLVMLGSGLEMTLSSSLELEAKALGFLVFIGLGFGLSAASSTMMAMIESSVSDHAPAQGIMAQSRILGGSIGIAASSAILAAQEKSQLAGIVSPEAISMGVGHLTEFQYAAVRKTFAEAFTTDMKVCTVVSAAGLLFAIATYRRNRASMADMRKEHVQQEEKRRQDRAQDTTSA